MVRLNNPWRKSLSQEDFEKYPVWTWDDENVGHLPLTESEPSSEYGNLFIKARFFVNKQTFDGYLVGYKSYYAFCLFIKGHKFMMNLNLPEFIKKDLQEIYTLLGCEPFRLFPLHYKSDVIMNGHPISGFINPKSFI